MRRPRCPAPPLIAAFDRMPLRLPRPTPTSLILSRRTHGLAAATQVCIVMTGTDPVPAASAAVLLCFDPIDRGDRGQEPLAGIPRGRSQFIFVCGSASSTSWPPWEWQGKRASLLFPTSCTSCPPCGSEFLLRGGDKNQSKCLPQGGQEVQEEKLRSEGSNSHARRTCLQTLSHPPVVSKSSR